MNYIKQSLGSNIASVVLNFLASTEQQTKQKMATVLHHVPVFPIVKQNLDRHILSWGVDICKHTHKGTLDDHNFYDFLMEDYQNDHFFRGDLPLMYCIIYN